MKTVRQAIAGIIVIAAVLLAFVSFLLITNYTSQTNLQQTLLEQFRLENGWRAQTLAYFFNDRREDLINLSSLRETNILFETRTRNISGESGRQILHPIRERFEALLNHYRIGQETAYLQIALFDENGTILVQTSAGPRPLPVPRGVQRLIDPGYRTGVVLADDQDRVILISTACFFKGRHAGQIVAWVNPHYIADHVMIPQGTPARTSFLASFTKTIYLPEGASPVPLVQDLSDGFPVRFEKRIAGKQAVRQMIGLSIPVKDTPFAFVTTAPVEDILGGLEPRGLLVGMGILAIAIIGGGFIIVRTLTRSLMLQANLDASLQHEREVREKNRQLEKEITERKQAEAALRRSEEQYRTLVEASPDVIFTLSNEDGVFRSINTTFEQITGWSRDEWIGKSFIEIIHPDDRPIALTKHQEAMNGAGTLRYELRCLTKSGEYRVTELTTTDLQNNGVVTGRLGIARDITERSALEEKLRQAVKMQAVGQLAGGIAHDFNNILSIIISASDLMLLDLPEDHALRSHAEMILKSAERGAQLTRNLLTFSRKQIITMRTGDLNEIIRSVEPLIARLIREDLQFTVSLAPGELKCLADSTQIEQVLMNLAANASDAMSKGGRLTISTDRLTMNSHFKSAHGFGQDGDYAVLRVEDTGYGMDDQTRERVFEPFFTTKEVGKGTGLGLATVFGIVKQHRGYIDVRSAVGKGTTFTIYIPLITESEKGPRSAVPSTRPVGGKETILLAEDDEIVRTMLKGVLSGAGYRVVEAKDGHDAEMKFVEHQAEISLLVFDVIMPNKNGKQAYDSIRSRCSDIKCLFLSGYASDIIGQTGISEDEGGFIQKPVMPALLLSKIREILDLRKRK